VTDYSVGPGVQQAIEQDGGEARSDERFVILTEGSKVSMTFATTGVYYYYEADNQTKRTPF
jgi:plastocyanin